MADPEESGNPEDAMPSPSEILGQDDIDSLLQEMQGGGEEVSEAEGDSPIIKADGTRFRAGEMVLVEPYDFRNPAFLGEAEMRRLRLMHEDFIRFLEARFALFLRMDFNLSMTKLTTIPYEQAVNEVENPSHIVLFKASPMPGMGFLEVNPRLALTVASSILGGKGQAPRVERYLTKIEIDLIEEFLFIMLQEWCGQWKIAENMEPTIMGHEVVANVLQICEHDTVMLSLTMDAELRGCSGRIGITVPLYMLEDAVRQMQEQRKKTSQQPKQKAGPLWRLGYESIPVSGKAVIRLGEMTVRDISQWKPGTVVPLKDNVFQEIVLRLAGIPVFECEAGVEDDQIAVSIKKKIEKQGALWNLKK